MQVHVRVNHLHVAKPYRCLFCAESFTSEMELQCHLTTHSKPFRCPMCEQAFHIEYLLDQHMQTDHGEVDIKTATLHASTSPALASLVIKEEAEAHGRTSASDPSGSLQGRVMPGQRSCDCLASLLEAKTKISLSAR